MCTREHVMNRVFVWTNKQFARQQILVSHTRIKMLASVCSHPHHLSCRTFSLSPASCLSSCHLHVLRVHHEQKRRKDHEFEQSRKEETGDRVGRLRRRIRRQVSAHAVINKQMPDFFSCRKVRTVQSAGGMDRGKKGESPVCPRGIPGPKQTACRRPLSSVVGPVPAAASGLDATREERQGGRQEGEPIRRTLDSTTDCSEQESSSRR